MLVLAAALAAVTTTNPSCGTCEAERSTLLWPAVAGHGWTRPMSEVGWHLPSYRDLSPKSYPSYLEERARCKWKDAGTLAEHNSKVAADAGWPQPQDMFGRMPDGSSRLPFANATTKVCTLPPEVDGSGSWTQWVITRVAGVAPRGRRASYHPGYRQWGFLSAQAIFVCIPRPRAARAASSTFVVQSINSIYNATSGKSVGYPPLHTHHANTFLYGAVRAQHLEPALMYSTNLSVFASSVHGMRHADFVECEEGVEDTNACALVRLDKGGRLAGYPVYDRSYECSDSLLNFLGSGEMRFVPDLHGKYTREEMDLEFGRKYAVDADGAADARASLYAFDFALGGSGNTFHPHAFKSGRISVGWHVYHLPATLRFHSSWVHTHAQGAVEVFVLEGDVEEMLPARLVHACYARGGSCEDVPQHGRRGQRSVPNVEQNDMLPGKVNLTAASVLQSVIAYSEGRMATDGTQTLRCQYKSRNAVVDGLSYTRASAQASATLPTCADWTASAGSYISLLVFSHPPGPGRSDFVVGKAMSQHVRWYSNAEILHGRHGPRTPNTPAYTTRHAKAHA